LAAALLLAATLAGAQQYRGFWADAFHSGFKSEAEVDRLLDDVKAAGANALFVQMRRRGDTYFPHPVEPPAFDPQYSPSFDALKYLVRRGHRRGIEIHAWAVVGPAWRDGLGNPPDPRHVWNRHGPSANGEDMWLTVNDRGETAMRLRPGAEASYALDLGHPAAARYLADVVIEPLKRYDIDGIHLDYIRYPEYPGDWGRNPVAVARFGRLHGVTGPPAIGDPRWDQFRRDQVTALVRQIYVRAHALKPKVKVSASVITWGDGPADTEGFAKSRAYAQVFQDWRAWLEEGILDLAVPMNYFRDGTHAAHLDRWLEFEKNHQYGRMIVPGLGAYLNPTAQSLAQAKRALARSAAGNKVAGVTFYSYAGTNNSGDAAAQFCRAVRKTLGKPGKPPAMKWLKRPSRATVYGWVTMQSGPEWLADGVEVLIESDRTERLARARTDGTGFFGAVDLAPDRYRVRVVNGGREIFRTVTNDVRPGRPALFHIFLKESDLAR
jgi:uncharacterized lipoprotein YddW (UPF0748 family)